MLLNDYHVFLTRLCRDQWSRPKSLSSCIFLQEVFIWKMVNRVLRGCSQSSAMLSYEDLFGTCSPNRKGKSPVLLSVTFHLQIIVSCGSVRFALVINVSQFSSQLCLHRTQAFPQKECNDQTKWKWKSMLTLHRDKKMLLFVFLVSFKSKLSQVDLCSLQTHLELACNKRLRHSSKEEYQLYRETGTAENTLKVAGRQVGNVSLWKRDINKHKHKAKQGMRLTQKQLWQTQYL